MDGFTAFLAGLLGSLRAVAPAGACPGGWAWAVTLLGVGVGLLPTAGLVVVAVLRRRIGSRYGVPESALLAGTGILTAGLLPLLVFMAAGRVFSTAAAGLPVAGLGRGQQGSLAVAQCIAGPPQRYLGVGSVAESFFSGNPLRLALSLVLLILLPLSASVFVAVQARIVLRRGPRWPARFFWGPTLALAVLSAGVPAGTAGHLWIGVTAASMLGILIALAAGAPAADVVRRSLTVERTAPVRPGSGTRPSPTAADRAPRPSTSQRLAQLPTARDGGQARAGGVPARKPAPSAAAAGPTRGAARFRVVRKLGAGGFGRVWLAHDARLDRLVALKSAHAPDPETEERIRREFQALAAIRHPHCVRIYDMLPARSDPGLTELDGMVLVMDYVEGVSLGDMVRNQGLLDDVAAARVWFSLAGALDAAHRRGVMHRDIKPGNVIVDATGLAHLIDFGIARKTGDSTMTQAGFVLGTPDFLAPEVACGERATPESDGWQLAATVSYALTGHPPRGSHPDAVSGLRSAASGAKLSHLPQRTAHHMLLRAALDTDPARRPPLADVQKFLRDWLRRTGAAPDGPVTAIGTRVR